MALFFYTFGINSVSRFFNFRAGTYGSASRSNQNAEYVRDFGLEKVGALGHLGAAYFGVSQFLLQAAVVKREQRYEHVYSQYAGTRSVRFVFFDVEWPTVDLSSLHIY